MKNKEKEEYWNITLTREQLYLISRALEFTSRFYCGQIGNTFLPPEIQELLYVKETNGNYNWDQTNNNKDKFDVLGNLLKNVLHPELSPRENASYGIGKSDYSGNLYDIYKMINHTIFKEDNKNARPSDIFYNVDSNYCKFGNLPDIKVEKYE